MSVYKGKVYAPSQSSGPQRPLDIVDRPLYVLNSPMKVKVHLKRSEELRPASARPSPRHISPSPSPPTKSRGKVITLTNRGNVPSLTQSVVDTETRFRDHIEKLEYTARVLYFTRTPADLRRHLAGLVMAETSDREVIFDGNSREWRHIEEVHKAAFALLGARGRFMKSEHDLHGIRLGVLIGEREHIARTSLTTEETLQREQFKRLESCCRVDKVAAVERATLVSPPRNPEVSLPFVISPISPESSRHISPTCPRYARSMSRSPKPLRTPNSRSPGTTHLSPSVRGRTIPAETLASIRVMIESFQDGLQTSESTLAAIQATPQRDRYTSPPARGSWVPVSLSPSREHTTSQTDAVTPVITSPIRTWVETPSPQKDEPALSAALAESLSDFEASERLQIHGMYWRFLLGVVTQRLESNARWDIEVQQMSFMGRFRVSHDVVRSEDSARRELTWATTLQSMGLMCQFEYVARLEIEAAWVLAFPSVPVTHDFASTTSMCVSAIFNVSCSRIEEPFDVKAKLFSSKETLLPHPRQGHGTRDTRGSVPNDDQPRTQRRPPAWNAGLQRRASSSPRPVLVDVPLPSYVGLLQQRPTANRREVLQSVQRMTESALQRKSHAEARARELREQAETFHRSHKKSLAIQRDVFAAREAGQRAAIEAEEDDTFLQDLMFRLARGPVKKRQYRESHRVVSVEPGSRSHSRPLMESTYHVMSPKPVRTQYPPQYPTHPIEPTPVTLEDQWQSWLDQWKRELKREGLPPHF